MLKLGQSPDLRAKLVETDNAPGQMSRTERDKLSAQFESLLVHELIKSMRATVQEGSDDFGVSMSMGMMDEALSQAVAGRLGLGQHLLAQVDPSKNQPAVAKNNALPSSTRPVSLAKTRLPWLDQITPIHARPMDALPVDGTVSSQFGERPHPISGKRQLHHGIDIAADKGQEIYAVRSGKVTFAGPKGGYGNTVEIRHSDGSMSRYAHAEKIHVRVGDRVLAGECVADVGSTGHSTGPHLHFEIRKFGSSIDPLTYLKSDPSSGK